MGRLSAVVHPRALQHDRRIRSRSNRGSLAREIEFGLLSDNINSAHLVPRAP